MAVQTFRTGIYILTVDPKNNCVKLNARGAGIIKADVKQPIGQPPVGNWRGEIKWEGKEDLLCTIDLTTPDNIKLKAQIFKTEEKNRLGRFAVLN